MLAAIAISTAAATPSLAETAEEAVAYAFMGLEDGATYSRGKVDLSWSEVSASPAVFTGRGEGKEGAPDYMVTFTIKALSDCEYEIDLAGPPGMVPGGKALYARVTLNDVDGVTPGPQQVTIEGDGFCATGQRNPTCMKVKATDIFAPIDAEKHTRLLAQLRDEVCVAKD